MSVRELKSRIRSIGVDALATATAVHGDEVRGWWYCVASPGPVHVETDPALVGIDAGIRRADAIADEGAGVVLLCTTSPVSEELRALVGLLCGVDATRVNAPADNDLTWMQACARLRDAQTALRDRMSDALDVVDTDGAGLVGLLLALAARGTPVVLVGTAAHAAAVIAQRQSLAATGWWRSGYCGTDPLESIACGRLQYRPWWTSDTRVQTDVLEQLIVGTISSLRSSR